MKYILALLVAAVCGIAAFFFFRFATWLDLLFTVRTPLFVSFQYYFAYIFAAFIGVAMFLHVVIRCGRR